MIAKCSNCDNLGSPFGKVHEEFEDRPINEMLCVFCGDEAIEKGVDMTHDELLAKIGNLTCCSGVHELALRTVIELHKPGNGEASRCEACYMGFDCPTIQAIEEQLK